LSVTPGHPTLITKEALPQRFYLRWKSSSRCVTAKIRIRLPLFIFLGQNSIWIGAAKAASGQRAFLQQLCGLEAARSIAAEFQEPAAVIIKHNNPCGTAEQQTLREAYLKAYACDPISAFGGVLAFNREVDPATAEEVAKLFVECIAAPGFDARAKEIFAAKKNLRLLELPAGGLEPEREQQLKRILGGMLVQQPDLGEIKSAELKVVTQRAPSAEELATMKFAWKVAKHVKSNAIVFAKDGATLGVGAGQMSRVDSVKLAVMKAQSSLQGSIVASDAFFPFPDGVEEAAKAGAVAVIQPGGSVRDNDVIAAADRLGMAMSVYGDAPLPALIRGAINQRNKKKATATPKVSATTNPGTFRGRIPAKLSQNIAAK
jgi:phosphoribosylaminoimidazolecarboxamide formyltransferase/IMP cyclohydrolase